MIPSNYAGTLAACLLCVGALGAELHAQPADEQPIVVPPLGGSLRGLTAEPIGEFKRYVNRGWGVGGDLRWFPAGQGWVSLRGDATFINYGNASTRECFGTSCRITVRINTSNNIFSGLAGPELQVPTGPIRPYVNAMAGWTIFWTQSSAEGSDDEEDVFRTTNLRDNILSSAVGGGVRIPIAAHVSLDFNARRNFNGTARYLTRDSFVEGSTQPPTPRESAVNMWTYSIGFAFGR